jgi:hypothetical protein
MNGTSGRETVFDEAFYVELDGLMHPFLCLPAGRAGCDAAGEVGRVGKVVLARFFDDDKESAHYTHFANHFARRRISSSFGIPFQSDTLVRISFSVPLAISLWRGTVMV